MDNNTQKHIKLYADGACSGNPGPGGWAAILLYRGHEKEISGFEDDTTNNRMELLAAIRALENLKEPCDVNLYTDSAYLADAFQKNWVARWERQGWRLKDHGKETKNVDLWRLLIALGKTHSVQYIKVSGHSDNALNNRCDKLAVSEISKNKDI